MSNFAYALANADLVKARAEIARLQAAKTAALKVADERTMQNTALRQQNERLEATVTAWRQIFESIEAHLMDRVNMRDMAAPQTYLSIIRSEVANINRSSDAIVNARWADHARANAENERLLALTTRLRTAAESVCWFDWSNNDRDAVEAITELRLALGQTSR